MTLMSKKSNANTIFEERECWFKSYSYTIIFPMPDPELPNKSNKEKRDRLYRSYR